MSMNYHLNDDRLETKFQDAKPLYSESEAKIEANRCLFCFDAPCIKACPTQIDIPGFIRKIASGNIRGSAQTIFLSNILGASTARVCPVEELCSGACVYNDLDHKPIQIGRLQRFATHKALELETTSGRPLFTPASPVDKKVALIGAGPASLSCAAYLALEGVHTVIYEINDLPGGLNLTGIAPYKFMAADAMDEINWLVKFGLNIRTGTALGRDISLAELMEENDAVFLGIGLGRDTFPGIPGEESDNVFGATDLIRKIKNDPEFELPYDLKKAVVIGGGNTAIDIARELAMLGVPEVDIVYRRTKDVMPGYSHELSHARENGVRLLEKQTPIKITNGSDGRLQLFTEHTDSKTEKIHHVDWIVMAIGQLKFAREIAPNLEIDKKGRVIVDDKTRRTSIPNLYAGGDCINGGKEVVNAVADGRDAAHAMFAGWGLHPVNSNHKIGSNGHG
ncbi:MAG: FAD-dependent oxidoreductase [Candidatus Marinimicrobia bacterium]|nr:FAD-dependent oxidoreductase [Candidatus Neomarinimicrobiota bacterium]